MMPRTNDYLTSLPSVALAERHLLPPLAGIYFPFADPNDILYVGMSTNLRQRWRSHHRYPQIARRVDVRIHYLVVDNLYTVPMLAQLERYCINRFDPLLNTTPIGWKAERQWLIGIVKKLIADKVRLQRIEQAARAMTAATNNQEQVAQWNALKQALEGK